MSEPDIRIKYDGGDAENNSIDMRLLGMSLQGSDKIISDGLVLLVHGRAPKRRERAPVATKVREPVEGSYELWAMWEAVKGLLPLGVPKAADLTAEFISEWWSAIISKFSGKSELSEKHIDAMVEIFRHQISARESSEERTHELLMLQATAMRETMAMQARAIEQFVAPIGPSVERAAIYAGAAKPALLSTDDAEAIRERTKLEWQPVAEIVLRTDGFKFHTNGLSVEHPDKDGYLMARVLDPRFEKEENEYTEAAQRKSSIKVLARQGFRGADLAAIDIIEFLQEISH